MYDPTVGRWISEDPLGLQAGDNNTFRYVNNQVLSLVDPEGLQERPPKPTNETQHAIGTNVTQLGIWAFNDSGELVQHFEKLFDKKLIFRDGLTRGCVGLAMYRLGFAAPLLVNKLTGKEIKWPYELPGARLFTDHADAKAYADSITMSNRGKPKEEQFRPFIIAWQEDGISIVKKDGRVRPYASEIFVDEVDFSKKTPENLNEFNFATWDINGFWEYMNRTFECHIGDAEPIKYTKPIRLHHSTKLPANYDETIYIVYVQPNFPPDKTRPDPNVGVKA